jgi:hypothetical protein
MAKKPSLVSQELLDAAKAPKARKGDRKPADSVQHHIDATDVLGSLKLHKSKKAYGGAVPDRIPIDKEDPEAYFRRLISWSFAVAPLFGRQHRADGGSVQDIEAAIRAADEVNRKKEASHEKGVSGAVEFAPLGVTEPLSGTRLPLGSLPRETAQVVEPALQAASEIAPYFTPAAPIAAARDVAVGLREGDPTNVALSALGLPGKAAKAAAIGASAFMPEEAQAGIVDRALKAIRAYHGSPHEFEKFDPAFIGSGEGAQAYGHGLYFAENPEIAEQYHRELADPQLYLKGKPVEDIKFQSPEYFADMALKNAFKSDFRHRDENPFDFSRHHLDVLKQHGRLPDDDSYEQALNILQNWKGAGAEVKRPGHVYEVGIHADPDHMLDWDKHLSRQSPYVKGAMSKLGFDVPETGPSGHLAPPVMYREIGKSPVIASENLKEVGVPGIKYLDQGSRDFGEGTRNYVVFDPNLIDIKNKYAEGGDVEAQPEVAQQPSVVDRALNFVSQFNPVGTAEAGPLSTMAKVARKVAEKPAPVALETALERVASPFSQDPERVRQAIELARNLRINQATASPEKSYYKIGQSRPVQDVTTQIGDIPNLELKPEKKMSWEDFYNLAKGSRFINLGGDRSNFGRLTHINEQELAWPIDLHAGTKYMREPSPGAIWANAPEVATSLKNAVREEAERGDVYGIFSPMGPQAVDSSHNMFDALMAQIPNQKISKKDAKAFDQAIMSGFHVGSGPEAQKMAEKLAQWPGINNPKEASEFARSLGGGDRRAIVQYMDTAGWRNKGFPMVGETRAAITDPELRGLPKGMMGHRIVKFNPENITPESVAFEHSTYPVPTGGEYVGDVPPVLRHYVMPEAIEEMVKQPAKDLSIIHPFSVDPKGRDSARKFFEEQKLRQEVNQRFLDSVMKGMERQSQYGLKRGGSVIDDALDVVSSLPK